VYIHFCFSGKVPTTNDILSTADGAHAAHFWQCLSEAYATGHITTTPVYDRPKIDLEALRPHLEAAASGHNSMPRPRPLNDSDTPSSSQPPETFSTASGDCEMRILLSDKQLLDLKTSVSLLANGNGEEERLSTQDCLSAALAISLSRAREEAKCALLSINMLMSITNVGNFESSLPDKHVFNPSTPSNEASLPQRWLRPANSLKRHHHSTRPLPGTSNGCRLRGSYSKMDQRFQEET
jgi:hypothetical protein